jgi:antitoxin HicB
MEDIKYYKNYNYKMIFYYDPEDKIYIVQFPELPGCLAHGETAEEALKNAYNAKDEWLESALKHKCKIPEPSLPIETTGRITLRMPKSIHQRIIERAEEEDISQNQLILTFIAEGLERAHLKNSVEKILQKQTEIIESINKYQATTTLMSYNVPIISDEASLATATAAIQLAPFQWWRDTYKIPVSANKESNIPKDLKNYHKEKESNAMDDSNSAFVFKDFKQNASV